MGKPVWYMAAKVGNLEILEKIWEWAKEKRKAMMPEVGYGRFTNVAHWS
jgi:hypothetical protein